MLITQSNNNIPGVQKRTWSRNFQIGPISIQFVTLVILAAAALFILAQTTHSATQQYKVEAIQKQKEELIKEKERLQLEKIRLESLNELKNSAKNLGLE